MHGKVAETNPGKKAPPGDPNAKSGKRISPEDGQAPKSETNPDKKAPPIRDASAKAAKRIAPEAALRTIADDPKKKLPPEVNETAKSPQQNENTSGKSAKEAPKDQKSANSESKRSNWIASEAQEIFHEIFTYDAALPKAPEHPEGFQIATGLSTLSGVLLPCCQNILGVQLFLRLTWIAAEAGALESFQLIFTCAMITLSTSISMSAIATNGPVPAGGAYYMISRCVGPEFGGAVGILFFIGNTLGVSMYILGAVEILLLYMFKDSMLVVGESITAPDDTVINNFRIYGTAVLLLVTFVVFLGVMIVTKFALVALLTVAVAILSIYAGFFAKWNGGTEQDILICAVGHRLLQKKEETLNCTYESLKPHMCPGDHCDPYFDEYKDSVGLRQAFPGLSSGILMDSMYNLYSQEGDYITSSYNRSDYQRKVGDPLQSKLWVTTDESIDFMVLIGIFFPSVTGIMAGANRSGDLRNPQVAIPRGTIAAQLFTSFIYLSVATLSLALVDRAVVLDKLGLSIEQGGGLVLSYIAWPVPQVISIGALLATVGAGLQSLTGAPRLLQAIAIDGLTPVLNPFAKLSARGEPLRALVVSVIIAEMGVLIGTLDMVAALLSMFYLLFYAGVNTACVVMSLSANPGWRPSYHYYHWTISFVGVILCVLTMFSISYVFALVAFSIFAFCFYGIKYFGGVQEWGSGIRGLALSFATQSLIRVSRTYGAVKYWRPQILHIIHLEKIRLPETAIEITLEVPKVAKVGEEKGSKIEHETYEWKVSMLDLRLLNLGSQIKHGSAGLAIAGCVLTISSEDKVIVINKLKEMVQQTMKKQSLDGLAEICVSADESTLNLMNATSSLIQLTGLGALRPNTLMVSFPESRNSREGVIFKRVLEDAVAFELAVIVPVGGATLWGDSQKPQPRGFIDMVLLNQHDSGLLLMIAYLIHRHPIWYKCTLRVLIPLPESEKDSAFEDTKNSWLQYLHKQRIEAQVMVFSCGHTSLELNEALRFKVNSSKTRLTLMSMRKDPEPNEGIPLEDSIAMQLHLDRWLIQCKQRIKEIDNCIYIWNAGVTVIHE